MSQVIQFKDVQQREGERLVNKKHLARLRLLGCCMCGHMPVEVHHLLSPRGSTQRGMGKRAGDDQTVALCPEHHRAVHKHGGLKSFERKYGLHQEADYQFSLTQESSDDKTGEK